MKKLFSLLLALCMMISVVHVFAEEGTDPEPDPYVYTFTTDEGNVDATVDGFTSDTQAGVLIEITTDDSSANVTVDGDMETVGTGAYIDNMGEAIGDASLTAGDVTVTGRDGLEEGDMLGINVDAGGGEVTIEAGNIEVTAPTEGGYFGAEGLYVFAEGDAVVTVTKVGDIVAEGVSAAGIIVDYSEMSDEEDETPEAEKEKGEIIIQDAGDITVTSHGQNATGFCSDNDGTVIEARIGDVTADAEPEAESAEGGDKEEDYYNKPCTSGIGIQAEVSGGETTIEAGTVTAEGDFAAYGITTSVYYGGDGGMSGGVRGEGSVLNVSADGVSATVTGTDDVYMALGVCADVTSGEANFEIGEGGVTAKGDNSYGVYLTLQDGATVTLTSEGDVSGESGGIIIDSFMNEEDDRPNNADIFVDGTIAAGEEGAIIAEFANAEDNISVTVWQAELNGDGAVVGTYDYSYDKEFYANSPEDLAEVEKREAESKAIAADIEKNINYIILVEQPAAGGTLSATDKDGAALAKSHERDVAKEGDKVLLKVSPNDGYELTGAYNGKGEKTALLKDEAGNFYIIVPKGGGVYLTAILEQIKKDDTTDDTTTDDTNTDDTNTDDTNTDDTNTDDTNTDNTNTDNTKTDDTKTDDTNTDNTKTDDTKTDDTKTDDTKTDDTKTDDNKGTDNQNGQEDDSGKEPGNQTPGKGVAVLRDVADTEGTSALKDLIAAGGEDDFLSFLPANIRAKIPADFTAIRETRTMGLFGYNESMEDLTLSIQPAEKVEKGSLTKVLLAIPGSQPSWFVLNGVGQADGSIRIIPDKNLLRVMAYARAFLVVVIG